ncbi:DUF3187 family protein [Fontimonas sp. SYSU GA230001]|uniref:DUF3187 family protein n=1 Tax=Fontimonas sp. SYSU GA230001 TaxID=3142450 RepID=UPI0032B57142
MRPCLSGLGAAAILSGALSGVANARQDFVFSAFNQAALARHAPLPMPGPAQPVGGWRTVLDWTSEFVLQQAAGETVRLDGETLRLGLQRSWRRDDLVLGVELPVLVSGGGVLDAGIENWHDWFGLPNGGREQVPRNEYRYTYTRNGETMLDIDAGGVALGDIRLDGTVCGLAGGCARAMVQLPTGDPDRLFGGGLGASGWYERAYALGSDARWTGVFGAGLAALRADGPLEDMQQTLVPFGWLSLGYALTDALAAGVQFYWHAPLYDGSGLAALADPGGQLVFGFAYRSAGGTQWHVGFQEDPIIDASPDFVIHLSANWGSGAQ